MTSEELDDLAIVIDPDDLENFRPPQFSHRQRPSLKTTREITRFVRRYQRRLSFSPPSAPLIQSLNTKNALPAIKRGAAEGDNGSSEEEEEEDAADEERNAISSPHCQNSKRKNPDLDLSQMNNNDPFLNYGGIIPSAFKGLTEDRRQAFQTIDMLNAQTLDEPDVRIHPKVVPQLPPIGMSSLPRRPSSPLPSQRRKRSDASISDDEWTEGKEEEEDEGEGETKDIDEDDDDVTFDKTLYFGHGDEVLKIVL